ncbi:unnamed protein product [Diplocarpon coronariae]|uniref:F-box domain-containing protein n=1 Tax=Diplocarpon coronariae TaxID=2795749 RepID=A0A218Z2I6_9HELO|nr:hypothetical protein B2J93_2345 [Marssonina coronariae]
MPLLFLEAFPREIRDQIYVQVLASQTGEVTLSPWTLDVARSLSLLRSCRQIHRECKDLIWHHNRLTLWPSSQSQLAQKFRGLLKHNHARRIRLLKVTLELLDHDELDWFTSSAKALRDWCRRGRLESITIAAEWDKPRDLQEFKEIQNLRRYGETVDGRLYRDSSTWTRMVVNTGWPRFCHWGKQKWLREMLLDPSGVNELLLKIHNAFGGQMYVDGLLCFKDHRQILEGYHFDPRNGEIRIVPGPLPRQDV